MFVRRLALTNFRNYQQQDISLPRRPILVLGDNAQGKTNLLEALFLLATTRSPRALSDGELIRWEAQRDPQPVARLVAQAQRGSGAVQVEMVIVGRPGAVRQGETVRLTASKRWRVNGVPRRQGDVVGQINAVFFTSDDLELVGGAPALRRRYLDITLSQVDRPYLRDFQAYSRVLTQRNALLRRIQEGEASPGELAFWNAQMAQHGGRISGARARAVSLLAQYAGEAHRHLSVGQEELGVAYQPRLPQGWDDQRAASASDGELVEALREGLESGGRRDIAAGASLLGPHRDDLVFTLNGVPAGSFASRGQQRTTALALRLAEARFLLHSTGEYPVLLLDDVLSELDVGRRSTVLEAVRSFEQILVTSADADRFSEGFLESAAVFRVEGGRLEPAE
jgi:DNA replication and repair protein RecF